MKNWQGDACLYNDQACRGSDCGYSNLGENLLLLNLHATYTMLESMLDDFLQGPRLTNTFLPYLLWSHSYFFRGYLRIIQIEIIVSNSWSNTRAYHKVVRAALLCDEYILFGVSSSKELLIQQLGRRLQVQKPNYTNVRQTKLSNTRRGKLDGKIVLGKSKQGSRKIDFIRY